MPFQHVCLWCRFKIWESFKYNACPPPPPPPQCPPLFQNMNSSFENTNSSFENTNSSFKNTTQAFKIRIQAFKTVADTLQNIQGGGQIFNMYTFGVRLRHANLSNIMLVYPSRFRGGVFLLGVLLGKQAQRKCRDPYFIKN